MITINTAIAIAMVVSVASAILTIIILAAVVASSRKNLVAIAEAAAELDHLDSATPYFLQTTEEMAQYHQAFAKLSLALEAAGYVDNRQAVKA